MPGTCLGNDEKRGITCKSHLRVERLVRKRAIDQKAPSEGHPAKAASARNERDLSRVSARWGIDVLVSGGQEAFSLGMTVGLGHSC